MKLKKMIKKMVLKININFTQVFLEYMKSCQMSNLMIIKKLNALFFTHS